MRLGTIHSIPWIADRTQGEAIGNLVERMVFAEQCGFVSSWLTEHHFANDLRYQPFGLALPDLLAYELSVDPLTILTFVAARTSRLRRNSDRIPPGMIGVNTIEALHERVRFVVERNAIGSPETCLRRLEGLRDRLGLRYVLCMVDTGGVPHGKVLASMARLAEHVLPKLATEAVSAR